MDETIKVLCVDDEPNVLRALARIFCDESFETVTATDAEEGLRLLTEDPVIKVVVSDYRMPGMDGVQFLKEVRRRRPESVRLVLSGYAEAAAVVAAVNEGHIYKFIPKPWQDEELRLIVRRAVELYRLQEENRRLAAGLEQANRELREANRLLAERLRERTDTVHFQGLVLEKGRAILDALPVGVIGLDIKDRSVVACNEYAARLLGRSAGAVLLREAAEVLPPALTGFIDRIPDDGQARTESLSLNDGEGPMLIRGVYMLAPQGQQGIILLLERAANLPE